MTNLESNNWGIIVPGRNDDPMDTFDVRTLKFPHPVGWCVANNIQHNWRHTLEHSFHGPNRSVSERYCINCGQVQRRTPERTVPATPWTDVD